MSSAPYFPVKVKQEQLDDDNSTVLRHIKEERQDGLDQGSAPAQDNTVLDNGSWWSEYVVTERDVKPALPLPEPDDTGGSRGGGGNGCGRDGGGGSNNLCSTTNNTAAEAMGCSAPLNASLHTTTGSILLPEDQSNNNTTFDVMSGEAAVKMEPQLSDIYVSAGIIEKTIATSGSKSARSCLRSVRIRPLVKITASLALVKQETPQDPPPAAAVEASSFWPVTLATTAYYHTLPVPGSGAVAVPGDATADNEDEEDIEDDATFEDDEINLRTRRKMRNLLKKSKRSKLKMFRKEKPVKMRLKSGTLTSTGEFNPYSYQCPYCPFHTNYIIQMKRHRYRHILDGALNCKRCEYTTKDKVAFKDHLIKHYQADTDSDDSDEDEDEDDEVENTYGNFQDLSSVQSGNKDLYRFHSPLPSIPGAPTNIGDSIIAPPELKLFEKILDLRCKYCAFFTTYRSIMNQHKTIHQAEGVMYCPQCDLSTRDKDLYKEHLMKHYERDSFTCSYCGYTTISQYLYQNHIVKHTENTYCCQVCNYTTGFKKAFKYHCLKHSEEKLLRCKHCPFITKYRHNYRQHMATHTGKGLLFCDFCSFYSAWETNFSRHVARHKIEEETQKLEEQARLEAELSFATK